MKVLNREAIKYIAIVLMLMDHVIQIFMERGTFEYNLLDSLSHFTFITMSFFLVEGYKYTKSKKLYAKRLFLFGLISQLPYILAFSTESEINYFPLNICFSLEFSFLMIWGMDSVKKKSLKVLIAIAGIIVCTMCDWMFFGALFAIGFYLAKSDKKKIVIVYLLSIIMFGGTENNIYLWHGEWIKFCINILMSTSGMILSGICILLLYNRKCMKVGKKFNKWFFYIFYPAHLLVLGIIRVVLM